jgi:hypothetical protein
MSVPKMAQAAVISGFFTELLFFHRKCFSVLFSMTYGLA